MASKKLELPSPEDLAVLATSWLHEAVAAGEHPAGCQDLPCRIARQILSTLGHRCPIPKPDHKVDSCPACEAVRKARNTRPRKRTAKRKPAAKSRRKAKAS